MFKFNNTHIFTGYLKQKLSSVYIPTCKVYTREFAAHKNRTGNEDPRVIESIDNTWYNKEDCKVAVRVPYLRNNEVYNYFAEHPNRTLPTNKAKGWVRANNLYYESDTFVPGLTRKLQSAGRFYDTATHEYLGEYLRFVRDYHGVNLMSLYNCFNNTLCNNLNLSFYSDIRKYDIEQQNKPKEDVEFVSQDTKYKIYAIPVKMFADYTIAIDSTQGVEICCGLYNKHVYYPNDTLADTKTQRFGTKTYLKVGKSMFSRPFLFDKLNVKYWPAETGLKTVEVDGKLENRVDTSNKLLTRWDIANRERDLRMFIKVPVSCKSSIVVLEGDYRYYNDVLYTPNPEANLTMEGCCVGRRYDTSEGNLGKYLLDADGNEKTWCITGKEPIGLKKYQLSDWRFAHSGKGSLWEGEEGVEHQPNILVPSLYFVDKPEDMNVWVRDELTPPPFSEEANCCEISTAAELAFVVLNKGQVTIIDEENNARVIRAFKLVNDIYLNDPTKINWDTGELIDPSSGYQIRNWFSRNADDKDGGFAGVLDGNGHTIYGLYFKCTDPVESYTGLIPLIDADDTTTLKNIGLNYVYLCGSTYASAFVGGVSTSKVPLDRWKYRQNHSAVNLPQLKDHEAAIKEAHKDKPLSAAQLAEMRQQFKSAINDTCSFKPISKLQLLAFNTGESHPFADRLIEYLIGSVITPMDEIPDNIKRAQKVMKQNSHNFKIEGLWENKMQKILYDYVMNAGPIEIVDDKLVDKRSGYQSRLGHTHKSTIYDILGYVDKDTEKWYASSKQGKNKKVIQETISTVDIYDGLYDI